MRNQGNYIDALVSEYNTVCKNHISINEVNWLCQYIQYKFFKNFYPLLLPTEIKVLIDILMDQLYLPPNQAGQLQLSYEQPWDDEYNDFILG